MSIKRPAIFVMALFTLVLSACGGGGSSSGSGGASSSSVSSSSSVTSSSSSSTVGLSDWSTFQGNAAHTGYAPVTLDPTKFAKAWQWDMPNSGGFWQRTMQMASGQNKLFVSTDGTVVAGTVYALNEADGSVSWNASLPNLNSLSPPAYSNGQVYVQASLSDGSQYLYFYDSTTGSLKTKVALPALSGPGLYGNVPPPVPTSSQVLAGFSTGVATFDNSGSSLWQNTTMAGTISPYAFDMPASDGKQSYYYDGEFLSVFNAISGGLSFKIANHGYNPPYTYNAAPILTSSGNALAFQETETSWFADRTLVYYNLATQNVVWKSSIGYTTAPAVANGVVYAGSMSQDRLDAINEADGKILWSWTPPATSVSSGLYIIRNVIVTDNLLFVSTYDKVYAIDLKTHQSVWSFNGTGQLALSANAILYIGETNFSGTGPSTQGATIVAIKLK